MTHYLTAPDERDDWAPLGPQPDPHQWQVEAGLRWSKGMDEVRDAFGRL